MKSKKIRSLKVYARYNNPSFKESSILPEIRLKGIWLKNWGFSDGTEIYVIKTEYGIIIRDKNQKPPTIIL